MLIQKYNLWRKMMEHLVNTGEQLMWFVMFTVHITRTVYSIMLINLRLTFFSVSKILYPVLFRTKNNISITPLEKKIIQAYYNPFANARWKPHSNTIVCVWKSKCGIFIHKATFQWFQMPDTVSFSWSTMLSITVFENKFLTEA